VLPAHQHPRLLFIIREVPYFVFPLPPSYILYCSTQQSYRPVSRILHPYTPTTTMSSLSIATISATTIQTKYYPRAPKTSARSAPGCSPRHTMMLAVSIASTLLHTCPVREPSSLRATSISDGSRATATGRACSGSRVSRGLGSPSWPPS
jgi:hypothetical protein